MRPVPMAVLAGLVLLAGLFSGCATSSKPARDFIRSIEEQPLGEVAYIPNVDDFDYRDRQYGYAPLDVIFRFWGIRIPRRELAQLLANTGMELATSQEQMMNFSDHQGLWAFSQYGSMKEVETRVAAGMPVIVLFQEGTRDAFVRRYAVVVGFNRVNKTILCHEGADGPVVYSYSRFRLLCRPLRYWMLTVCPPEIISWPMSYLEIAARAKFYEKRGRYEEAIADWERALAQQPENVDLLLAVGNTYRHAGMMPQAEQLYRRAIGINNMHARACNNLAFLLVEQHRNLDEALLLARRATLLEPNNPAALDTLGMILIQQGNYADAANVLEKARRRSRNLSDQAQTAISLRLAEAYHLHGQDHLVLQVLRDLLERFPETALPDEYRELLPLLLAP